MAATKNEDSAVKIFPNGLREMNHWKLKEMAKEMLKFQNQIARKQRR